MMKLKQTLEKKQAWETLPKFSWNLKLTTFMLKRNNESLRFAGTNAEVFQNTSNFFIPQKLWKFKVKLHIKLTEVMKVAPQGVPWRFFFSMTSFRSFVENQ